MAEFKYKHIEDVSVTIDDDNDIKKHVADEFPIHEVYDDEAITEYVKENIAPEDVFDHERLEKWASENGWKEEDE